MGWRTVHGVTTGQDQERTEKGGPLDRAIERARSRWGARLDQTAAARTHYRWARETYLTAVWLTHQHPGHPGYEVNERRACTYMIYAHEQLDRAENPEWYPPTGTPTKPASIVQSPCGP